MQRNDETILARLENKALHYLGRYASTAARLEQVLVRFARRKMPEEEPERMAELIRRKVEDCIRRGYVNDRLFAEQKAAALRQQGASRLGIRRKLGLAGIDRGIIEEAISEQDGDTAADAEAVAALIYARRRRLGPFSSPDRRKEGWQQRHLGNLARAGFSSATARFVLAFNDPEDAETWLDYPDHR